MIDKRLLSDLRARLDLIPTCMDYYNLLRYAQGVKGMPLDSLRDLMGCKTYADWADYLCIA